MSYIKMELENVVACLFSVLALVIMGMSVKLGFGRVIEPGPGFFPFFTGLLLLVSGLVLLKLPKNKKDRQSFFQDNGNKRFWGMILALVGWLALIPLLGYVVVTFIAMVAFAKIMGLEGWGRPVVISLSTTIVIYIMFSYCFSVDLPVGMIG